MCLLICFVYKQEREINAWYKDKGDKWTEEQHKDIQESEYFDVLKEMIVVWRVLLVLIWQLVYEELKKEIVGDPRQKEKDWEAFCSDSE